MKELIINLKIINLDKSVSLTKVSNFYLYILY